MRKRLSLLIASSMAVAACTQPADDVRTPTAAAGAAAHLPGEAQVDRFLAEGPDPTLRKLAVADYWLHYKLMQATGIERELGGETQAIAALQALGDAYERKLRGAEAEMPKLVPAAFTGEGMASGFMGLGMGNVAGMMTGGMMSGAVGSMSDEHLADLVKAGPIRFGSGDGKNELQIGKDGSLSQSMEFEVNEHGLNGKVKLKTRMDACPDPEGKVAVDIEVDSQMSVQGKPGTGGHVHTQFRYERYLDDDAHLIDSGDGAASNLRIQMGGFEKFQAQRSDITVGYERGGKPIFIKHEEQGYSMFRPEEGERAGQLLQGAALLQTLVAEAMLRGMGSSGGSPWEGGRCVKLDLASSPGKRKGVKPNTAFDLEAKPRARADGAPTGGTVTATLDGAASLQPASGKVPADAQYGYAGPGKKNESASIAFESRSKRGVGKATLEFDTKASRAYRAEGGLDDFHGTGTICDLSQPFTIGGGGNTVTFTPSSEQGGSYQYSGNMGGIGVYGKGTYTASADENGGRITGSGNGCVKTPMGTRCANGTERYTLTPVQPCE
ncbi:MAG: hypothetical protein EOP93_00270 [Lysobacteraceae bacterium]|nr:MAG: hypothetical protein EOP93_00270 [Xanthomonadaceae bacterium]